jgi:AbiV family abortive infection protein
MKDAFKNFSSQDYIQGACLTLENAQRHIKASELLFNDKNIGIAISHLILGAEEYIKSFILLCLNGDDNFIDDNEKVELFKNHKFKHKHISLFLESISDSEATKFEQEMLDRFINNTPHPSIYSLDGHYINNVFKLVKLDDNKLQDLKNWLVSANDLKNNGFYLGVDDNWRSPDIYNEVDYLKTLECIKILKDTIEPLFEMPLTDDDFIDYLNRENIS